MRLLAGSDGVFYTILLLHMFSYLHFLLFILLHILKNRINYELRMSVSKERLLALHSTIQRFNIRYTLYMYYLTVNRLVGPRNNKRNQHLALWSEEKIWNKCSAQTAFIICRWPHSQFCIRKLYFIKLQTWNAWFVWIFLFFSFVLQIHLKRSVDSWCGSYFTFFCISLLWLWWYCSPTHHCIWR